MLSMTFLAIAVFVILVCYNLPWHNLTPYLHTICSEGQELKKAVLIGVSLHLSIESSLFLGATF